jgi:hypothetical protein
MKKILFIFIIFLTALFFPSGIFAKSISISVTTSLAENPIVQNKKVTFKMKNSGDDIAKNVRLSILQTDNASVNFGDLAIGATQEKTIDLNLPKKLLPGYYIYTALVEYTDTNGYAFSLVSPVAFSYVKSESLSDIIISAENVNIPEGGEGNLNSSAKNFGKTPIKTKVSVYASKNLQIISSFEEFEIGTLEQKISNFNISAFSALAGSAYPTMVVAEYAKGGLHYSFLSFPTVNIVQKNGQNQDPAVEKANAVRNIQRFFAGMVILIIILALVLRSKKAQ